MVNIFKAIHNTANVKVLDNVTSDKYYQNRDWVRGYRENAHMGGIVILDVKGGYALVHNATVIIENIPLNPARKRKIPRTKRGRSLYFICYNIFKRE